MNLDASVVWSCATNSPQALSLPTTETTKGIGKGETIHDINDQNAQRSTHHWGALRKSLRGRERNDPALANGECLDTGSKDRALEKSLRLINPPDPALVNRWKKRVCLLWGLGPRVLGSTLSPFFGSTKRSDPRSLFSLRTRDI
jgi:hypothetical protein